MKDWDKKLLARVLRMYQDGRLSYAGLRDYLNDEDSVCMTRIRRNLAINPTTGSETYDNASHLYNRSGLSLHKNTLRPAAPTKEVSVDVWEQDPRKCPSVSLPEMCNSLGGIENIALTQGQALWFCLTYHDLMHHKRTFFPHIGTTDNPRKPYVMEIVGRDDGLSLRQVSFKDNMHFCSTMRCRLVTLSRD
jgi:hypothetical protein